MTGFVDPDAVPASGGQSSFVDPDAPVSRPLPANAGVAKLLTSVIGMPVDTVENVLNLGISALGYGSRGDPAKGIPSMAQNDLLKGSVGGSQWLQDRLRSTGIPALSPDNPAPESGMGTAQYDFVSRGGVIPGGAIPAVGSMVAEKIGGPAWAPVGAMLPSAASMAVNEATAAGRAQRQAGNTVRDETLKLAQEAGYKVIPSHVNGGGPVLSAAESLGGKAAIRQQATLDNQAVTDRLARADIRLPENAPITMQALEAKRHELSAPYRALEAVSTNAAYYLRELRDSRQKATQFWHEYERNATVSSLENYKIMNTRAKQMEAKLEAEAVKARRPDLVPQMREARQELAKTWDVEKALNLGDGTIDAQKLGRLYDRGSPLSGNLEIIAKFAQGPGRQVTSQGNTQGTPNVSKLNWTAGGLLGAGGLATLGPVGGAVAAAAPFVAPPAARSVLLSDAYQRNFARPNYEPATVPEGSLQSLVRLAIMENERARK